MTWWIEAIGFTALMMANAVTFFGINCVGFYRWNRDAQWFEKQRRAA